MSRYFLPTCMFASFGLRMAWIGLIVAEPLSDFEWYYERGMDLAAGRGYSINGIPTAFWPIGYPAFLALEFSIFGPSLLVAKLSNVLLYIGILYLSYLLAKGFFSSEFIGRTTLAILAFYPNHIAYSSLISTETLFLFLLLLGTALLLKAGRRLELALITGLVFGLSVLVKTHALLLPVALFFPKFVRSAKPTRLRRCLLVFITLYVAMGLTTLPWIIRNYYVFGGFLLSNNDGLNLLYGNNPYATGTYEMGFGGKLEPLLNYTTDEYERNVLARRVALNYILEHPLQTIGLWPMKLFYLYNEDGEGFMWNEKGMAPSDPGTQSLFRLFIRIDQAYYLVILLAFIISLPVLLHLCRESKRAFPIMPLLIITYFTLAFTVSIGHSRLHFPLMPWMVIYAAALLGSLALPSPS